jgi:SET domain-containing protein
MFMIKTRLGESSIHGVGVFACEDIPIGGVIWRFHPPVDQVLPDQTVARLPDVARAYINMYAYHCADLGGQLVLSGDNARFLNHSDDPNTEERSFMSIARKNILFGDEITCDYGAFCTDWTGAFT